MVQALQSVVPCYSIPNTLKYLPISHPGIVDLKVQLICKKKASSPDLTFHTQHCQENVPLLPAVPLIPAKLSLTLQGLEWSIWPVLLAHPPREWVSCHILKCQTGLVLKFPLSWSAQMIEYIRTSIWQLLFLNWKKKKKKKKRHELSRAHNNFWA